MRARAASVSTTLRRVQRHAEMAAADMAAENHEEEESEGTGDENARPHPSPPAPASRPFLRYMDGLGDRERSIR